MENQDQTQASTTCESSVDVSREGESQQLIADDTKKVVIYGGNGFVGTHVAHALLNKGVCTACLSRSGHKPLHLKDQKWSESVRWCKGNALEPDTKLLERVHGMIALVGSAPLPTTSREAYEAQVIANGETNASAIKAAGEAGIKRIILVGAKLPFFLQSDRFGYAKGKRIAMEAARAFSELSNEHRAVVLQPGMIFGKRFLKSGKSVSLDTFFKPLSYIMPWQFVCVNRLAERVACEMMCDDSSRGQFIVIKNSQI